MSRAVKLSEDLRALSELKSHSGDVVRQAERTGRPVVLTRHGKGVAVVLSLRAYEEMEAATRRTDLQAAVDEAEESYSRGEYIDEDTVDAQLRKWESGE